jgi:hypothetical protein
VQIEEIKIFWEGPFKINDILEDKIDKSYSVSANDMGLYQVYGTHPLYGSNVLVYIGRTKNKKGFKSRLKDRWVVENGSDTENVQIYLGTIFSDNEKIEAKNIDKMIEKSEVLLINAMKPAYNSSNIQSANEDFIKDNFILHNEGNYRNIYPVLDSKYFWQPYKNFAIVNELADLYNIKKINDEDEYYGFSLNDIDEFDENPNYTLWFGVQYEEWNKSKIALELQIIPVDENIAKRIKSLKIKEFKYIQYDNEEQENYFQIEFTKDFFKLESDNLKEAFKIKVNEIINLIKF